MLADYVNKLQNIGIYRSEYNNAPTYIKP